MAVEEPAPDPDPDLVRLVSTSRTSTGRCGCSACHCSEPTGLGVCPACREGRHPGRAERPRPTPRRAREPTADRRDKHGARRCKAATKSGGRCKRGVAARSKHLCAPHASALADGRRVVNVESGRAFPKPRAR